MTALKGQLSQSLNAPTRQGNHLDSSNTLNQHDVDRQMNLPNTNENSKVYMPIEQTQLHVETYGNN